ncbi:thioesterase family protein [Cohaesibacter intestini]|uniref:thioesterase family protein n=1 Tax=Cohaesibacter intestini TaxID=2211145 RepID=UPI000DEB6B3A|nr:thioesterase family protein [Cohaesibacter intestini]
MTRFVSLNQFVNLWECDENDHMNVQFYFAKFQDAAQLFAMCHKLDDQLGPLINRHVRYHCELRGGAQIQITSSVIVAFGDLIAPGEGCFIQHVMRETTTGRIAATALDWHRGSLPPLSDALCDEANTAVMPRGLKDPADLTPRQPPQEDGLIIARGILHPGLCDGDMLARDQAYISAVSDAASHAWERVGLDVKWLESQGFGRMAVEMRLHILSPMKVGTAYQMQLGYTGLQARALTKRYDFFDMRDGAHLAILEAAVMLLNHTTRKSEPLPDFTRAKVATMLGAS